ncbi:MbtH family protein [Streptomyces sp. NPDC005761]|uniref:MbtH family protein n=1 Tax=unclassified Streptomyces TaxID=2593676 RepID=UPI0034036924
MANPFEDPEAAYHVLVNAESQHSLWPVFAGVPEGWTVTLADSGRQVCLDYINEQWTDMRPKSLVQAMNAGTD